MLTRRSLIQGVLSLAALGPLARVAVAEKVALVEPPRPYSLHEFFNQALPDLEAEDLARVATPLMLAEVWGIAPQDRDLIAPA